MEKQERSYPLQVGTAGQKRLAILNEVYNPATQQFLIASGLVRGMSVLEVGCGTGVMASWLAKQVGETGKVLAIDQSAEQIAVAKQNAADNKIHNIEFLALPVEKLDTLKDKFDLAFSRWTLCFVPSPVASLQAMYDVLKSNGILVIDDLSVGDLGCFAYPLNDAITRWMDVWVRLFNATGKELYFGGSLHEHFLAMHCHKVMTRLSQSILVTPNEKSVAALAAIEMREMAINSNSITAEAMDQLILDLEKLALSPGILGFLRSFLVSGRK